MPHVAFDLVPVDGVNVFYCDAGPKDAPAIVLLHGFPSSWRMFATLIPLLADKYRVIAPDYPGFGRSAAPAPEAFAYTFDHLAECVDGLLSRLGLERFALYMQDYGGPVGFRLAAARPARIAALVIQNAVAHLEGLSPTWEPRKAYWRDRAVHEESMRRALLSPDVARQRHAGHATERVDADIWTEELAFLQRPGMDRIQLELMYDYRSNVAAYPAWQKYLREHRPPTLVVWGRHDALFTVEGAFAFQREVPEAEVHVLDAGHFALDEKIDTVAALMRRFLARAARSARRSEKGRRSDAAAASIPGRDPIF